MIFTCRWFTLNHEKKHHQKFRNLTWPWHPLCWVAILEILPNSVSSSASVKYPVNPAVQLPMFRPMETQNFFHWIYLKRPVRTYSNPKCSHHIHQYLTKIGFRTWQCIENVNPKEVSNKIILKTVLSLNVWCSNHIPWHSMILQTIFHNSKY